MIKNKPKEKENRVRIDTSTLKSILAELNSRGFSNNQISKEIGTYVGNTLYKKYSINQDTFNKLKMLYGSEIPHKSFKRKLT